MVTLTLILMVGCLVVMLAVFIVGVIVILNSGKRDVVSTAREGWINRRSEKDQEVE